MQSDNSFLTNSILAGAMVNKVLFFSAADLILSLFAAIFYLYAQCWLYDADQYMLFPNNNSWASFHSEYQYSPFKPPLEVRVTGWQYRINRLDTEHWHPNTKFLNLAGSLDIVIWKKAEIKKF